jgi:hypothetical protein
MGGSNDQRRPSVGGVILAICLIVSFLVITVAAGHGVAPMFLVLFPSGSHLSEFEPWALAVLVAGLLGIGMAIGSVVVLRRRLQFCLGILALVSLFFAAVEFALQTKDLEGTLVTAIPFYCAAGAWVTRLTWLVLPETW